MVLAPACSTSHAATPPRTAPTTPPLQPAAATASEGERILMPSVAAAPAEPPAAPSPDTAALPALPAQEHAPAAAPAPAPASADTAPAPSAPPASVAVNINDELPFLAVAAPTPKSHAKADDDDKKHKKHHVKKLPPGTTSEHTTTAHRKRGEKSSRPYHPDPGIIVDITQAAGGANQAEVQKLARAKGYTVFRHCYEEGLRRNQHLSGKVTMDFTLGADGSVTGAHKTASTLSDESVNQCVVREASHLVLAKPDSGTPAVTMSVTLSPGDEPVPVPHAAPHADKLRDALRSKWSGVEVCYKLGLDRHADLGGRLELRFKTKPNGEILEAAEGDTKFSDVEVTKCVLGVYRAAKLPKIGGKKETQFVYALHLEAIPRTAPATANE